MTYDSLILKIRWWFLKRKEGLSRTPAGSYSTDRPRLRHVTCRNCGWIHFAITREYAEAEVHRFNTFFRAQTQEVKDAYGNKESWIGEYEFCFVCMQDDFYETPAEDAPRGVTLNPIIYEDF